MITVKIKEFSKKYITTLFIGKVKISSQITDSLIESIEWLRNEKIVAKKHHLYF